MTQPSKGAAVFLALSGLPFLGGGLLVLFAQLTSRPNAPIAKTITSVMASLVLVLVGGGLIYAATSGRSEERRVGKGGRHERWRQREREEGELRNIRNE